MQAQSERSNEARLHDEDKPNIGRITLDGTRAAIGTVIRYHSGVLNGMLPESGQSREKYLQARRISEEMIVRHRFNPT